MAIGPGRDLVSIPRSECHQLNRREIGIGGACQFVSIPRSECHQLNLHDHQHRLPARRFQFLVRNAISLTEADIADALANVAVSIPRSECHQLNHASKAES